MANVALKQQTYVRHNRRYDKQTQDDGSVFILIIGIDYDIREYTGY